MRATSAATVSILEGMDRSQTVHDVDLTKYFDRRSDLYRRAFAAALAYDDYVRTGKEIHQARWRDMLARVELSAAQRDRLAALSRPVRILVVSGTWCGDCVRQVPIVRRIAEALPAATLRILDRDADPDLRDEIRLCGAARVPVAIFLSEDFFECARVGDRPLATYRTMAATQLGPACPVPTGLIDRNELDALVGAWLDDIERVQLMLRLSPYLRDRYGD